MQMDVDTAIELIQKAFQKRDEERAYMLYASAYPHFDKNNFKSFEEFYKVPTTKISRTPKDEILSKAEQILKKAGEKRGTV